MKNIKKSLEAFGLLPTSIGCKIKINAKLIIHAERVYLVPRDACFDNENHMEIYFPNLESMLDDIVGGWVGGTVSYDDDVEVIGVIRYGTVKEKPLSICEIESFSLFRDGELFRVI
ncbi:hypothetical protein [Dickeya zeae]|jgi:hypothetical protein|uniref:hypothetical protein n=1 Tax=Dickeya zeae TaxID=204042 RepID=UPI001315AA68|nr:hypothetical protein [Dickeya zeae]UJR60257.1 hypothetical protein HJ580_19875 [Dickeya zeae]UJR63911.1 hypothetical protein HJ586_17850 [Dickeya zeae]